MTASFVIPTSWRYTKLPVFNSYTPSEFFCNSLFPAGPEYIFRTASGDKTKDDFGNSTNNDPASNIAIREEAMIAYFLNTVQ
jgi:hypothetical protein